MCVRNRRFEWLHAVDLTSASLTLTNLAREPTICLVDECDDPADEEACLQGLLDHL